LRFLQTVTETDGFVARTVIPADWEHMHDANRTYTAQEVADSHVRNPREKIIERWRPSADGKWLWKGDTSSDEITGHMYGYLFYYDLVADEREKKEVSKHVCRIVDYIIAGGYVLRDIDGQHTKWAVWAPEFLNDDPDWRQERGINSVEILSYLKLAIMSAMIRNIRMSMKNCCTNTVTLKMSRERKRLIPPGARISTTSCWHWPIPACSYTRMISN
jgi:hypothetical protein